MPLHFLKTGAASAAIAAQEQVAQQARKDSQGKAFRFSLKQGDKGVYITFVDGELDPETGNLLPPRCYEHTIKVGGKWTNFVCPEQTDPSSKDSCPICEDGDTPALVSFFTVIDHRTFESADGKKVYKDRPKLFACKPLTCEELNAIAQKRGGLAGCTFEVRRQGDKSAGVGSHFDFEKKTPIAELQQKYVEERTDEKTGQKYIETIFKPLDYEGREIIFRTGDELRKMGIGKASHPAQGQLYPGGANQATTTSTNYAKNL